MDHPIRYGLLKDFHGSDTLLLLSTGPGFAELAERLSGLRLHSDERLPLEAIGGVKGGPWAVFLRRGDEGSSLQYFIASPYTLDWVVGPEAPERIAMQLRAFSGVTNEAAHHYLETTGDAQIVASVGEYDQSIWLVR